METKTFNIGFHGGIPHDLLKNEIRSSFVKTIKHSILWISKYSLKFYNLRNINFLLLPRSIYITMNLHSELPPPPTLTFMTIFLFCESWRASIIVWKNWLFLVAVTLCKSIPKCLYLFSRKSYYNAVLVLMRKRKKEKRSIKQILGFPNLITSQGVLEDDR